MKKKYTINNQANKMKKLVHKFWNDKREDAKLVLSQSRFKTLSSQLCGSKIRCFEIQNKRMSCVKRIWT